MDFAGDILELSTSKSSSTLFPVPLVVPLDWKGSNGDPPAAAGFSQGPGCDDGVPHGSLGGSVAK